MMLSNRHVSIIDYRQGEPLNYDGTFNPTYSGTVVRLSNNDEGFFHFENVHAQYINVRQDWSDLNKWRSKITFTAFSYRDGLDFLAL